jgi:hypothetical protein
MKNPLLPLIKITSMSSKEIVGFKSSFPKDGFVYFIKFNGDVVKIGKTRNLKQRLECIRRTAGRLSVIREIYVTPLHKDYSKTESLLLNKFNGLDSEYIWGENFNEILDYASGLNYIESSAQEKQDTINIETNLTKLVKSFFGNTEINTNLNDDDIIYLSKKLGVSFNNNDNFAYCVLYYPSLHNEIAISTNSLDDVCIICENIEDDYIALFEILSDNTLVKNALYAKYQPNRIGFDGVSSIMVILEAENA